MTHRRLPPSALLIALPVLLLGCPKKPPPPAVEDAAPAPTSPPTVTELAPLIDDGGVEDAAAEAGPKKYTGPVLTPNQSRIAACCTAMRVQAKQMGPSSPEAFQVNALAVQCDVLAKQVGPGGTAPEFAQLRQVLKSVKLPAACSF